MRAVALVMLGVLAISSAHSQPVINCDQPRNTDEVAFCRQVLDRGSGAPTQGATSVNDLISPATNFVLELLQQSFPVAIAKIASAELLDKRYPPRQAAALTQNEIDALRAQIQTCWKPHAGALDAKELIVRVRLQLRQDGSLSAEPTLLNRGNHPMFQNAAESAMRAMALPALQACPREV